jgi:hypothetical protein
VSTTLYILVEEVPLTEDENCVQLMPQAAVGPVLVARDGCLCVWRSRAGVGDLMHWCDQVELDLAAFPMISRHAQTPSCVSSASRRHGPLLVDLHVEPEVSRLFRGTIMSGMQSLRKFRGIGSYSVCTA